MDFKQSLCGSIPSERFDAVKAELANCDWQQALKIDRGLVEKAECLQLKFSEDTDSLRATFRLDYQLVRPVACGDKKRDPEEHFSYMTLVIQRSDGSYTLEEDTDGYPIGDFN